MKQNSGDSQYSNPARIFRVSQPVVKEKLMFKVMMEKILSLMYYDRSSPASYGGKTAVYKAAKALCPKITRRKVATWLSKQFTCTVHKPVRYHFKTNRIFAKAIDCQCQADLADLGSVQKYNDSIQYLLTRCFVKICVSRPAQKQDWSFSGICIQNYFVKQPETNIPTN